MNQHHHTLFQGGIMNAELDKWWADNGKHIAFVRNTATPENYAAYKRRYALALSRVQSKMPHADQ